LKYKTTILFFLICFPYLPISAQDELWSRNWHADRAKSGVKKAIILERSGKRFDTLHIYQYDSLGRKIHAKEFGNKNSGNHTMMALVFKDTLCTSWTASYKFGDIENGTYKYNARGNLLSRRYCRIKSGDTSIQLTSIYSYNVKHQLLKEKTTENGLPYFEVLYFYNRDKLVRKMTNPYNGGDPDREELYYYNASGLLDSSRINSIKGPIKKVLEFRSFRYEKGRMVETIIMAEPPKRTMSIIWMT
jgi:hypothetical protein